MVSVIVPTYLGAAFIAETLDSALAQTHRPLEVLVVDDASPDGTAHVVEDYVRRHPDVVRLVRASDRRGPCRRRNDALALARGDVIAWLDHDDLWEPGKLERQVAVLRDDESVALVYSDWEEFDGTTGRTLPRTWPRVTARGDILGALFVEGAFMCSSTVVFRRDALPGGRLREADFSFGDDLWAWLAIALRHHAERIDDVLVRYRRHDANESRRRGAENWHLRRVQLLEEFVAAFPEAAGRLGRRRREGLARHYVRAAKLELGRRRPVRGVRLFARAALCDPAVAAERLAGEVRRGR